MDIRTKIVIVLVGISLASMWVLGFFAFQTSAALLKEISGRQLDALAQTKARDVRTVISSWHDRVRLVASRTQLRINLDKHNRSKDPELISQMRRIISDAQTSTPSVIGIALYDQEGRLVAMSGVSESFPAVMEATPASVEYRNTNARESVQFRAPLALNGVAIGAMAVLLSRDDLRTVTSDYTGLGEQGETIIARWDQGRIEVLHPLRHAPDLQNVEMEGTLLEAALREEEQTFMGAHTDYRGQAVWGATRYLPVVDWGLAVQLNVDEELQRVRSLRESMINLALSLSAFGILGGTALGVYLANPIRKLAGTVQKIRDGDTTLRAEVTTEDEVGELARALNDFMEDRRGSS